MIYFFLFTQPALSNLSCSCLVSGLDGKMDCTSVRSYTRGVWQTFYLCLWPRSSGQPSCCVQGHRVLPLDKPSAHLGDLFYNQLPGWPMALYTTSALCDTVLFVLAWCRPRTEQPASRAMSILCTFNLFRAFPHPSGMRLHQTLYRLYRVTSISVELCPLVRAYSHRGGDDDDDDEGSHFHWTVLSHGAGVRPQRWSPARWRLLPPQLP